MTVDSSLEDIFSAYSFAVDKHLPENGGDPKTYTFYNEAYKLAALHKACPMNGLQGEPLHAPIIKHNGTIGMRVRMAAGGGSCVLPNPNSSSNPNPNSNPNPYPNSNLPEPMCLLIHGCFQPELELEPEPELKPEPSPLPEL